LLLARGDTGSESMTQLTCHCEQKRVLPPRSNLDDLMKDCFDKKCLAMTDWRGLPDSCLAGSSLHISKPPIGFTESDVGESPGFQCHSESDIYPEPACSSARRVEGYWMKNLNYNKDTSSCEAGLSMTESSGVECDIGVDTSPSDESETTWLKDDEIHNGNCQTMVNKWIHLCMN
jgi:hypothetical protein